MKLLTYIMLVVFLLSGCNATKKSNTYTGTQTRYDLNTLEITFYFKDCNQFFKFLSNNIETNIENNGIKIGHFKVMNEYNAYYDNRIKDIILQECIENMHLNDFINIFGVPYLFSSYMEHSSNSPSIGINAKIQDSILTNVKIHGEYFKSIE